MDKDQANILVQACLDEKLTNREKIAEIVLAKAALTIGKQHGIDFTYKWETFSITANKTKYAIGDDILQDYPSLTNMQDVFRTDVTNWPVPIKSIGLFSTEASGQTTTGAPRLATIYGNPAVLEVYPIPDKTYTLRAKIRAKITSIDDIPSEYYDVVADLACLYAKALGNIEALRVLSIEGLDKLRADGPLTWEGDTILFESIGTERKVLPPDRVNMIR